MAVLVEKGQQSICVCYRTEQQTAFRSFIKTCLSKLAFHSSWTYSSALYRFVPVWSNARLNATEDLKKDLSNNLPAWQEMCILDTLCILSCFKCFLFMLKYVSFLYTVLMAYSRRRTTSDATNVLDGASDALTDTDSTEAFLSTCFLMFDQKFMNWSSWLICMVCTHCAGW